MTPARALKIALVLCVAFPCCRPGAGSFVASHDAEIDEQLRKTIHGINAKLLDSIREERPSVMLGLFLDEVRNEPMIESKIEELYLHIPDSVRTSELKIYNEYYVVSRTIGTYDLVLPSESDQGFLMHLRAKGHHMYISLLKSQGSFEDYLVSFVYSKVDDEWRLYSFHAGIIEIAGKTAPEWFADARASMEEGYYVPALLRLQVASSCLRPAPFIHYEEEGEIGALMRDAQARFAREHTAPIRMSGVETCPEIYYIQPQFVANDLYPLIKYVTKIPFENVSALQEEVNAMTAELEPVFPGITKGVKHVVYQAFLEPPTDPTKQYQFYGLTTETKSGSTPAPGHKQLVE